MLAYLAQLGAAKRTSLELLTDRGFRVDAPLEVAALAAEPLAVALAFGRAAAGTPTQSVGEAMSATYVHASAARRRVAVVFLDRNLEDGREKMTSTFQVKAAGGRAQELQAAAGGGDGGPWDAPLLVFPSRLSPEAKREAARAGMQPLSHGQLAFAVGRHALVPRHTALDEGAAAAALAYARLTTAQLPVMKGSDAMAKYLGLVRGQLVLVERGHMKTLRAVV